jgi:hypothetical protein
VIADPRQHADEPSSHTAPGKGKAKSKPARSKAKAAG